MLPFRLDFGEMETALAGQVAIERVDGGIHPVRLESADRDRAAPMLAVVSTFSTGIRIRLRTEATHLRLEADVTRLVMAHLGVPATPAPFAIEVDGIPAGRIDLDVTALVSDRNEPLGSEAGRAQLDFHLPAPGTDVTIWLPPDAAVVIHGLSADAPVQAAPPDPAPVWLHHGSSISQCGDASTPLGTWPAQAARALGVASTNLGFGGNAMLDGFVARTIARTPADVITLKFGINVVASDAMRLRAFSPALHEFLDVIRDARPEVPICLITAIACPAFETTPGPMISTPDGPTGTPRATRPGDGTLTLQESRRAIAEVVGQRDDANLFLEDGLRLLGLDDAHLLADGIHPDQRGYDLMAARFAALARDPATGLGAAFARLS